MSFKTPILFIAAIGLAACGSSGGGSNDDIPVDQQERIDIRLDGAAVAGDTAITLTALAPIPVVPGTGGSGAGAVFSDASAFSYSYGQKPGVTPVVGGAPDGVEQDILVGQALFAVDTTAYGGDLPISGSAFYSGEFQFDHVTGIGTQDDGSFSTGDATTTSGDLFFEVTFDTLSFEGTGTNGTFEEVLTMQGQVGEDGAMTGTVIAAGITADLDGIIVGDPKQLSGAAGAFAGNTDTELLIGGFAAEGNEP